MRMPGIWLIARIWNIHATVPHREQQILGKEVVENLHHFKGSHSTPLFRLQWKSLGGVFDSHHHEPTECKRRFPNFDGDCS